MLYDYYCSHCGKQLNQDTVLFDMQYLLTGDETKQFNILKFRMTQAEFKVLIQSGTPAADGYRECSLTLADIMRIVGNRNNLNDSVISALTQEEIDKYLAPPATVVTSSVDDSAEWFDYDDEECEEADLCVEEDPYVKPPSIVALEKKCSELGWVTFIMDLLSKDLSVLQNLFAGGDVFTFLLHEENDTDNEGQPVLEGYTLKLGSVALRIKARICPQCDAQVFDHAGTAKHQAVAFIGHPRSGKTSTILALTDYAMNYMQLGFGSKIWEGGQTLDSVATIELVDKKPWFLQDMQTYQNGMAILKSASSKREDACSVTFRLSNKIQRNRRYLLTLIDLPFELCVEDGNVQWDRVRTLFPIALNCDACVLCFDTQSLDNGEHSPVKLVTGLCKCADEFQAMRANYNGLTAYVPTMLLLTKRDELADPNAPVPPLRPMMPLERMYMLKSEKQQIAANRVDTFVCVTFGEYGPLNRAYHATLRCTAYGYSPPRRHEIECAQRGGEQVDCHPPTPKNIDLLMRWILSVTGCIPTEASYSRGVRDVPYRLQNFCITRPQLRSQNPLPGQEMEEAMARCALFENPGCFDRKFVTSRDQEPLLYRPLQLDCKRHPDTNDRP